MPVCVSNVCLPVASRKALLLSPQSQSNGPTCTVLGIVDDKAYSHTCSSTPSPARHPAGCGRGRQQYPRPQQRLRYGRQPAHPATAGNTASNSLPQANDQWLVTALADQPASMCCWLLCPPFSCSDTTAAAAAAGVAAAAPAVRASAASLPGGPGGCSWSVLRACGPGG